MTENKLINMYKILLLNYLQSIYLDMLVLRRNLYTNVTLLEQTSVYNCKLSNDYICNSIKLRNAIRAD